MKKIRNIHPGEILREEFMSPLNLTSYRVAKETNIQATRINQIIHEKRGISPDTALRLSRFFGNSAEFWLGIQNEFDLRNKKYEIEEELTTIVRYA